MTAEGATGPLALGPSVYARIVGVELPQTGSDLMLNIEDYGVLSSLEVNALR